MTESRATAALPTTTDLPDADIVIFDGHCNFCRQQVRRLHWIAAGRLAFLSLHDPLVAKLLPDLDHDALMRQMYVVNISGARFAGASAIRYLSLRLPSLWIAAPLLHIPFTLGLWQFIYDQVAKHRYLIAGRNVDCENNACSVHFDSAKPPNRSTD